MMITGGNAGLGLHIAERYDADSYSRGTGHDIVGDCLELAQISLDYDVFVNNAYDGVPGESWHGFGQTRLLHEVAMAWQAAGKGGHIINIGGVGSEDTSAPFSGWESYNANKRALKHTSLQWTAAFRNGQVKFRTSLLTIDRLDTPKGRSTPQWTGNGVDLDDAVHMIQLCLDAQSNTCVGEIKAWVALDHKQQ
jgi:NAD(P)-dependent dehydrogenase (short-subunit alcohol dehydrogenase family)